MAETRVVILSKKSLEKNSFLLLQFNTRGVKKMATLAWFKLPLSKVLKS